MKQEADFRDVMIQNEMSD